MKNTKNVIYLNKWAIIVLIDLILVGAIIYYFGVVRPFNHSNIKITGVYLENPREMPDLNLIDQHGNTFTNSQLKGHWTLMFFGFTHCPTICPATFDALNKFNALLDKQLPPNLLPMILFVSIDPERDTVNRLNQYVNKYNPHFIGARANANMTQNLAKQLAIPVSGKNENIVHGTDILILNPRAQIQAYFLYPHQPQIMVHDYLEIIRR